MGYSLTAKADFTLKACMTIIGDKDRSNVFRGCFYEQGRENVDGAFTAQVLRFTVGDKFCHRSGSIRIEPDGKITRFPTMSKNEKIQAERNAKKEYNKIYGNY